MSKKLQQTREDFKFPRGNEDFTMFKGVVGFQKQITGILPFPKGIAGGPRACSKGRGPCAEP